MKKKYIIIAISIALNFMFTAVCYAVGSEKNYMGDVIVRYNISTPNTKLNSKIKLNKSWDFEDNDSKKKNEYVLVQYTSEELSTKQLIKYFNKQKDVVYVEPNYSYKVMENLNDSYVGEQWYINKEKSLETNKLWDQYDKVEDKKENVIAVIDTGVDYDHPDLKDNMWVNNTSLPGKHGYDFMNQDDDPMDDYGHGTHVAGIIAAENNNKTGVVGITKNTKIMALKYMDETGNGLTSQAIDAYKYIIDARNQGVNIVAINNSWGSTDNPKALEDIINSAGEKGIISVCAAGNYAQDLDVEKTFPAGYESPYTIVVGASTEEDEIATFSCYGKHYVDVLAPGTRILSTINNDSYVPGLANTDRELYTFEDNKIPLNGGELEISSNDAYEGNNSLKWTLKKTKEKEYYVEGDEDSKYTNVLMLEVKPTKEGDFFGINSRIKNSTKNYGLVYIEQFVDNRWMALGGFTLEELNFWNSKSIKIVPGTTKFRLIAPKAIDETEVYIDNLGIGTTTGKYGYKQGTSMAAPMVSSEVAMLRSIYPNESIEKIRARVIGGVDKVKEGLVASDGRVNFEKAMNNPQPVINDVSKVKDDKQTIYGEFLGNTKGKININDKEFKVVSWDDNKVVIENSESYEGYCQVKLIREDLEYTNPKMLFSTKGSKWDTHKNIPIDISNAASVGYENYVYLIGGEDSEENALNTLYRYDIEKGDWRQMASLPDNDGNHFLYSFYSMAVVFKDNILFLTYDDMYEQNKLFKYSIKNNKWTELKIKGNLEPRSNATLATIDDEVYIIGGIPKGEFYGKEELVKGIWKLSDNMSTWEKIATLNDIRYDAIACEVNGKIVITGGTTGEKDSVISTEIFDGKKVKKVKDLPVQGINKNNTVFGSYGKRLFLMTDGVSFGSDGLVYSTSNNQYESIEAPIGYSKYDYMSSAVAKNKIFAIGGKKDYRKTNEMVSFDMSSCKGSFAKGFGLSKIILIITLISVLLVMFYIYSKRKQM